MYIHTYIHVCSYKLLSALDALQCRSVALAIYRRRCTARKDTADGVWYGRGCYGIGYGLSQRHLAATIGSIVNTWPVRARCVTECRRVCVCGCECWCRCACVLYWVEYSYRHNSDDSVSKVTSRHWLKENKIVSFSH